MDHRKNAEPVFKGESSAQAYYGHFRMGAQWLHQENDAARANPVEGIAVDNADFALQKTEAGIASAQQLTANLVNGSQDRDTRLELALLYARIGNIERARQLADAISREFPLDTLTQNYSLPAIHAAIQLRQNDPAAAIETLKRALKYDSASPNPFNSLYPAYLRGLASPNLSSKSCWIILRSSAGLSPDRWRSFNSRVPKRWKETRSPPESPIRISSVYGKTLMRALRSWSRQKPNMPN
jgi:tetratricopeptide (TPR) repeat protein